MTDEVIQEQNEVLENQEIENENGVKKEVKSFEPEFTIRSMLEAGVHFGHRTARWNAKMAPYIYGVKNELHIIDLTQSSMMLAEASKIIWEIIRRHGKILFVCTKKQGADIVKEVAAEAKQYYVTNKWLGGMLTNWKTISKSIKTLKDIESELTNENSIFTKKEKLLLDRKRQKLENQLGGIREMTRLPDLIFVIDTPREALAIAEARSLGIPVMAIVDTNSDPDYINYPIPGNDDSIKAIKLYMEVIGQAMKDALENLPMRNEKLEDDKIRDIRKLQSRKASKSVGKFDRKEKLPLVKKEAKTLAIKEEAKAPAVKKEEKTPAVKKEVKLPAVEKKAKTPAVKADKK